MLIPDITNLIFSLFLICTSVVFYLNHKNFLIGLYLTIFSLMYIFPALIELLSGHHHPAYTNSFYQNTALFYISMYHSIFILSYLIFERGLKVKQLQIPKWGEKVSISHNQYYVILFILFIFSLLSKIYLSNINSINEVMSFEFSMKPFLQTIKAVSTYNLIVILIIAYNLKKEALNIYITYLVYYSIIVVSLYIALISGSRFEVAIILLIMIYINLEYLKKNYYVLLVPGFLMIIIFKASAIFRNSKIHDKEPLSYFDSIVKFTDIQPDIVFSVFLNGIDIMVTRFNYLDIVARTIQMSYDKIDYSFSYYLNVVSLVPRLFWEAKPDIGLDWHEIGQNLLILGTHDSVTSVGLGIIGESYYELKLFGLSIAIAHAFILFYINKKFKGINLVAYVLYPLLSIYIVSKDSLIAVLPGFIYIVFPIILILIFFNNVKIRKIK